MGNLLEQSELDKLYYEIELPLAGVLSAMEQTGIKVAMDNLVAMSEDIARKVDTLLTDIYRLAAEEFNVNSTKQLGVILFEKLKLPVQKKTKTGYSTDAEVLEKLAGEHPLIDKLLEYRMLTKLKSTYLDGMAGIINKQTGRVHTTFNQTVTATGRLSSSEPNLQNIPVRTEVGRKIRELFVPDASYAYLLSADYSQIELRVLAHIAGDDSLIDAFRHNKDIHTATASEVFGVAESAVTAEMRSRAKAVNFGIVYGISDYGLSRDIGVSRKEAGMYIDSYFDRYPGVKKFIDNMIADARGKGYVTTMFGRRRYLPEIHSTNFNQRAFAERTAMNTPIQGTAADIIKKAMVEVHRRMAAAGLKSRVLLQVHDELVLEVAADEVKQVSVLVREAMEGAVTLSVPLVTDVKTGKNWAEAK
jgi:DNA polymerase-1